MRDYLSKKTLLLVSLGLIVLLLSPLWIVKLPGYSPKDKWLETMAGAGNYHFFAKEIYERKDDIDILVIGDSIMWCGMDTDMIEQALSKKLGRKAVVLGMAANWRGEDLLYLQLKELLPRRRVKMLMIDMPVFSERDDPHQAVAYWWIMGEHLDDLKNMDTATYLKMYAVSLLGIPRHLLSFVRGNPELPDGKDIRSNTKTGALKEAHGFNYSPFYPPAKTPVYHYTPQEIIFSEATKKHYGFTDEPLNDFQSFFLNKVFEMAAEHHVHVVATSVPRYSQVRNDFVAERTEYNLHYPGFVTLASLTPSQLFADMSDEEIKDYYYDEHMNISGAELFTKAFLPTILYLYDQKKEGL